MSIKVTIRGCFSVAGKNGWRVGEGWDFGISAEKSRDRLVIKGDSVPNTILQVGNQIEIDLERNAYDRANSLWLERTNKPYMDNMQVNEWMNMIHKSSHVFDGIAQSPEEAAGTMIIDPPTVTLGKSRKLEFIIYLRGEKSQKNFLMLAEQNIEFDSANKQNFRIEFVVHKCGFFSAPSAECGAEEGNWDEELKSKLDEYALGYDGQQESAMDDFRKYVDQISEEAFEDIPVEYSDSEYCEFNSWGEEP